MVTPILYEATHRRGAGEAHSAPRLGNADNGK